MSSFSSDFHFLSCNYVLFYYHVYLDVEIDSVDINDNYLKMIDVSYHYFNNFTINIDTVLLSRRGGGDYYL